MKRSSRGKPTRRSVIGTVSLGAAGMVAGCLGGGTDGDSDSSSNASDAESFPDHPGDEPVDPPAGRRCDGPCGMEPADYPDENAQIAHAGGEGVFFDSVGCLVAYHHDPTFYDGPASAIETAWVRDFGTKAPIDAREAVFVHDYDKDRHDEVMAHNPKPFAERADALEYIDSYDDLDEDDIVDLDFFGAEEAHGYRDYPLPEE